MGQVRKINPRVDFAFKLIFERNQELLISLVNSIVSEQDQVAELIIQNPYNPKRRSGDKLTILDIKAKSTTGNWFNIEMQVTDDLHYDKRTLYYLCKLYSDQLTEGHAYGDLKKAISINILNFTLLDEPGYHNVYRIKHDKSNQPLNDLLELHYIELKKIPTDLTKIKTSLDRWVTLLAKGENYTEATLPVQLKKDACIKKALSIFETTRFDDETWLLYEARLKWLRDEASAIETAEIRGRQKGHLEGRAEGEKIGEARGIQLGEARGIQLGEARGIQLGEARANDRLKQTAKKMKAAGYPMDQISEFTGLSLDTISSR